MIRATTMFLAIVGLLASATVAHAEVVTRIANLDSPTKVPFDFDQVKKRCSTSSDSRVTTLAYSGAASLRVRTENSECTSPFSRGIFNANSSRHLVEGDDFWVGMAIYLPKGFYAAHSGYTDLLRVDSYVHDDGTNVPYADRAEISLASWSNDNLYVRAARAGIQRTLIGPLSPTALPEGEWHWIELHVKLSSSSGSAYTELKVDGRSLVSSKTANLFEGAAPLNRVRYGLVSTDSAGSGDLTAYIDRASLSPTELGPLQREAETPSEEPEPTESSPVPGRVGFWRLDELSGRTAADATGNSPGVYVNSPTLGVPAIDSSGVGTAVSLDGSDDYVEIAPRPPLDMSKEVTVEAWCKAGEYSGSLVQRFEAYELRPQLNGNLVWRVWIEGSLHALATGSEAVSPGPIHQFVGTYDGEWMRLYLDGVEVRSRKAIGPLTQGTTYPLFIGRNGRNNTYFGGVVDNVAIYSRALSAATVLEHFREGTPLGEA